MSHWLQVKHLVDCDISGGGPSPIIDNPWVSLKGVTKHKPIVKFAEWSWSPNFHEKVAAAMRPPDLPQLV